MVELLTEYHDEACDLLVALHAVKSAPSVERFARRHPDRPRIVVITGTDLHPPDPVLGDNMPYRIARRSAELADRVVFLREPDVLELAWLLDEPAWSKYRVIYQAAEPPAVRRVPRADVFEVCVLGHLRAVKDPFRTAHAAKRLPADSRLRVHHVGAALSPDMEAAARDEMRTNPRYVWHGERPREEALGLLSECRLLVMTSVSEGGPSAVSEALACGVPVVSTRIPGVVGLLGADYPGYFPVGDSEALAALLHRCETDDGFYRELVAACAECRPLISPEREAHAWAKLFTELG